MERQKNYGVKVTGIQTDETLKVTSMIRLTLAADEEDGYLDVTNVDIAQMKWWLIVQEKR